MGSAIPSTTAEIFLQYFEDLTMATLVGNGETVCYNKCVDDILIIFTTKELKRTRLTYTLTYYTDI